jgi:hypothetical protein
VTHPKASNIDYLDHTVVLTDDLDAAAARFRDLGFIVSPPSAHVAADGPGAMRPTGTANRCAYFGESFIELLGTVPASSGVRNPLAAYRGLHLTLGCGDVEVVARRWRADGLCSSDLWHMQREVDTEYGKRTVRATSVRVDLDLTPNCHTMSWFLAYVLCLLPVGYFQSRASRFASIGSWPCSTRRSASRSCGSSIFELPRIPAS